MTFIKTSIEQPGIVELLFYKGPTGKALSKLAHTLLHGPSPLSSGERELIAAHVSNLNNCDFCHTSHGAAASEHLKDNGKAVQCVVNNLNDPHISDKMRALLNIAGKVQISGREVMPSDIEAAKEQGANDEEIHDTVLIASAFCMYNRYVDGLNTSVPENTDDYKDMGKRLATKGYKYPPLFLRKFVIRLMGKSKVRQRERA